MLWIKTALFLETLATLFAGSKSITWLALTGLYTLTLTRKGEYKLTEWLTDGKTLAIIAADGAFTLRCTEKQARGALVAMDMLEALLYARPVWDGKAGAMVRTAWAQRAAACAYKLDGIGNEPEYRAWKQDIVKAGLSAAARDTNTEAWVIEALTDQASKFGWLG